MKTDMIRVILSLSAGGTVLALLLILLRHVISWRIPSRFYYYAWLIVLLRMAVPLPGLLPMASGVSSPDISVSETRSVPGALPANGENFAAPAHSPEESAPSSLPAPETPAESHSASPFSFRMIFSYAKGLISQQIFWLCLWAIGALFVLLRHCLSYFRFSFVLRRSIQPAGKEVLEQYKSTFPPPLPQLVKSPLVDAPMLIGLFRPLLVLPEREFSPTAYKNIFYHEITHYRRADLLFKWFSLFVFSLHWFNPFTRLFAREIDITCELSCDEHVLRNMDERAKRDYGEMLLDLANTRALSPTLVFTSLAAEKRALKERLEQIMTYKKKGTAALILSLAAAVLLCGCAAVLGPPNHSGASDVPSVSGITEPSPPSTAAGQINTNDKSTDVNSVDEFLASLGSHGEILLEEGYYDLAAASDYGTSYSEGPYTWEPVHDGYQLIIRDLEGLTITGASPENTQLVTPSHYSSVLVFKNCASLSLSGLSAGHTEITAAGYESGIIELNACREAVISSCRLFGCGETGITALNSSSVFIEDSWIYQCGDSALRAEACQDIRVTGCFIHDIKKTSASIYRPDVEFPASSLFQITSSYGFAAVNCEISDSNALSLMNSSYSNEVYFLGCKIENNQFSDSLLSLQHYDITIDNCSISSAQFTELYSKGTNYAGKALCLDGSVIRPDTLEKMEFEKTDYNGPVPPDIPLTETALTEDGTVHVYVKTVDEFLAAIAPDTTVYLDGESFDFSTASQYGSGSSDYYFWNLKGDGPELMISGVSNFHIVGQGTDKTGIYAVPRTANVLYFYNCENISLSGITAGHTAKNGVCEGGVLDFLYCSDVLISDCGLFGCGTLGVSALESRYIQITNTEIYECSQGASCFSDCENVSFSDCDIHDCPTPHIVINGNCRSIYYDGNEIIDSYTVD